MDGGTWRAAVHRVTQSQTWLKRLSMMHALEKEMATHSRILAWRIPGMEEPGGLPSMGSHRVRHDWGDLAAAAAIHLIEEYVDKYMSEIWPSNPADKAFFIELWTSTKLKINNGFFLELKYLLMGKVHLVKRSDGSYNKPVQKVTETLTFKREESYPCTSGAEDVPMYIRSLRPLSISTQKFPSRVNS